MGWTAFLILVVVQVVIAAIVIFVLKHLLEKELNAAALEKLHTLNLSAGQEVTVTSAGVLREKLKVQLQALLCRKSPDVKVIFQQDQDIRGGMIIELPGETLDFSIANRLKHFWS